MATNIYVVSDEEAASWKAVRALFLAAEEAEDALRASTWDEVEALYAAHDAAMAEHEKRFPLPSWLRD